MDKRVESEDADDTLEPINWIYMLVARIVIVLVFVVCAVCFVVGLQAYLKFLAMTVFWLVGFARF